MTAYRIFEESIIIEDKEAKVFGIAAFDISGEIIALVPNITAVREKAEILLEKCRRLEASPCQLRDIAEDYIISDEY